MSIVMCEDCGRDVDLDQEESYLLKSRLKVCKDCFERGVKNGT